MVVTNIIVKLLFPASEFKHWWAVYIFRVRAVGDHLRCQRSKLNNTIILTLFFVCFLSEYPFVTSANVHSTNTNIESLPDSPKSCLARNFTYVEFYVRRNVPKFNSINFNFLSHEQKKITKLCFEMNNKKINGWRSG